RAGAGERWHAVARTWPTLVLFVAVVGGIYFGAFDPTAGAAVGAVGAGILALWKGRLGLGGFLACLKDTARTTAMIFLIVLGADFFNIFLALTGVAGQLSEMAAASGLNPYVILVLLLLVYLVLGCFMDSLAMIF